MPDIFQPSCHCHGLIGADRSVQVVAKRESPVSESRCVVFLLVPSVHPALSSLHKMLREDNELREDNDPGLVHGAN